MIITIDTKKDSAEDIQRAIDILKQYAKPIIESDSKILESIPKETSTHRPIGPGIFDVQNNQKDLYKQEIYNEYNSNEEEERSTFKSELFASNNKKNIEKIQADAFKEEASEYIPSNNTNQSNFDHHGGRITHGTAPDFTSYLDLLKQKRDKHVLGILAEENKKIDEL